MVVSRCPRCTKLLAAGANYCSLCGLVQAAMVQPDRNLASARRCVPQTRSARKQAAGLRALMLVVFLAAMAVRSTLKVRSPAPPMDLRPIPMMRPWEPRPAVEQPPDIGFRNGKAHISDDANRSSSGDDHRR